MSILEVYSDGSMEENEIHESIFKVYESDKSVIECFNIEELEKAVWSLKYIDFVKERFIVFHLPYCFDGISIIDVNSFYIHDTETEKRYFCGDLNNYTVWLSKECDLSYLEEDTNDSICIIVNKEDIVKALFKLT